uniref:hypothetical protein n=1 Tax=Ruminococcus bicirculans (ex Wegman et al. 2014) TaxID=1160721 RepID=UPI003A90FFED
MGLLTDLFVVFVGDLGMKKGAVKKAQQSPWISSIWKPTGFNISHSKKELSNLEKRVQQTHRQKIQ